MVSVEQEMLMYPPAHFRVADSGGAHLRIPLVLPRDTAAGDLSSERLERLHLEKKEARQPPPPPFSDEDVDEDVERLRQAMAGEPLRDCDGRVDQRRQQMGALDPRRPGEG